jgi:hypothetical protein
MSPVDVSPKSVFVGPCSVGTHFTRCVTVSGTAIEGRPQVGGLEDRPAWGAVLSKKPEKEIWELNVSGQCETIGIERQTISVSVETNKGRCTDYVEFTVIGQ